MPAEDLLRMARVAMQANGAKRWLGGDCFAGLRYPGARLTTELPEPSPPQILSSSAPDKALGSVDHHRSPKVRGLARAVDDRVVVIAQGRLLPP